MQEEPPRGRLIIRIAPFALLALMGILMFTSAWNDTVTFDETAHIGAGFADLRKADYRLNAEHPPLFKDLAATPLVAMHLRGPWEDKRWVGGAFDEWDFGRELLYHSNLNPDLITRAARAPLILFTLAFGWIIFWWTRRHFGNDAALLALFFYSFSPTFLAHGRFVTNDVAAAAGFFVGVVAYLRFLRDPSRRNILFAGLAMGFAFLTKYSTVELIPIAALLAVAWTLIHEEKEKWVRDLVRCLAGTAGIFLLSYIAIYPIYLHHTWNYPPKLQRIETIASLEGRGVGHTPKDIVIWASDKPVLRPYAQYFRGVFMSVIRSGSSNYKYFLGQVYTTAVPAYFPFVYAIKEPLALHLLTLLALAFAISGMLRPVYRRAWIKEHFIEIALLLVLGFYWFLSIRATLNIGVRHLLPTFAFVYILVANEIMVRYRRLRDRSPEIELQALSPAGFSASLWTLRMILATAIVWQAVTVLRVYPSYLAYFNELAGGPDGGWRYVVDSNADWGQDLKRLGQFVDQRGISEIYFDYFGSADTNYYLKGKERGLGRCSEPQKGWVAVSAMWYQHSREEPKCEYWRWLPMDKLVTKIGYSIFVFHID